MTMGRKERFYLRLLLSREQKKALDSFLESNNAMLHFVLTRILMSVNGGVVPLREKLIAEASSEYGLSESESSSLCSVAWECAKEAREGPKQVRPTRRLFHVPFRDVVFSVLEKVVFVPGLGLCKYVVNRHVVNDGYVLSLQKSQAVTRVGYKSNDPVIEFDTSPAPQSPRPSPRQKLVKLPPGKRSLRPVSGSRAGKP